MEQTRSLDLAEIAEIAEIADSTSSLSERTQEMLEKLRRLVPFDAAWLALADPMSSSYTSLASTDLDERTLQYLSGPKMARDIEVTHPARPPAAEPVRPALPGRGTADLGRVLHPRRLPRGPGRRSVRHRAAARRPPR